MCFFFFFFFLKKKKPTKGYWIDRQLQLPDRLEVVAVTQI